MDDPIEEKAEEVFDLVEAKGNVFPICF